MRKIGLGLACLFFLLTAARPAHAELKYTVLLETRKTGDPATPMAAAIGQMLSQVAPEGSVQTVYVVGARGLRAEINRPMAGMPAGSVILWTPAAPGELVLLNPAQRTFQRMALPNPAQVMETAGIRMKASVAAPMKNEPMLGVPTERWNVTIDLEFTMLSSVQGSQQAMAAMQRDSRLTGEIWTAAGRFDDYGAIVNKTGIADLLKATGLSGKIKGFVMRQIVRVGGYEMRSEVTKIAEEPVPASTFEIPAGYTEIK